MTRLRLKCLGIIIDDGCRANDRWIVSNADEVDGSRSRHLGAKV